MKPDAVLPPTLLKFAYAWRSQLGPVVGVAIIRSLLVAPFPFFLKIIVDDYVSSANRMGIAALCIIAAGLLAMHACVALYGAQLLARAIAQITEDLRSRVFHKLQFFHFGYLDRQETGRLLSKYTTDTQRVEMCLMPMLSEVVPQTIYGLCIAGMLFIMNWQLLAVILAFLPVYGFSRILFFGRLRRQQRRTRLAQEQMTATASELIAALRLVRGYGQEGSAVGQMDERSRGFAVTREEEIILNSYFGTFTMISIRTISFGVISLGAIMVIGGTFSIGTLFAFLAALPIIVNPINVFISFSAQFFRGREGYYSLHELITSQYVEKWKGRQRPNPLRGEICFDNVDFSYGDEKGPVLSDINLTIGAGEKIAFVGPSGSGKTTLANLVLGLYHPNIGQILIDGIPQEKIDMRWLRRHCAIVMQESLLLSGTVIENIRFAKPNASEAEVRQAADLANVTQFVDDLPQGFQTIVGERGATLSGGQRQRISIARAILRDPRILILDEATSSLDYESERLIQQALERLSEGRTVITIAHRLQTVQRCDRLIILGAGRILDQGSYHELLGRSPLFRDFVHAGSL